MVLTEWSSWFVYRSPGVHDGHSLHCSGPELCLTAKFTKIVYILSVKKVGSELIVPWPCMVQQAMPDRCCANNIKTFLQNTVIVTLQ